MTRGRAPGGSTDFSSQARTTKPKINTGSGESPKVPNDNRPPQREEEFQAAVGGGAVAADSEAGMATTGTRPRAIHATLRHRTTATAPHASRGAVYLPDAVACQGLAISIAALLAGATDADGDNLTILGISSSSGTLTRTEDGGWEFDRAADMLGEVRLTYAISDGSHIVMQTAYFNVVEAPPIFGTEGDDILLGTQCAETIVALGGDDNVDARGGNDRISGGDGNDHILAGAGNDVVYADAGDDMMVSRARATTWCSAEPATTACTARTATTRCRARTATTNSTAALAATSCWREPATIGSKAEAATIR